MNVYHRLINILAESINPEYWSIDELMHYLRLAQNQFARQTQLTRKNARLVQCAIMPVGATEPVFTNGAYELPDDCLDIVSVQWQGRSLDKKGLTYLETAYTGTENHDEIRGLGRRFEQGWRTLTGTPAHWTYDNGRIRIVPTAAEQHTTETITDDITESSRFAVNFPDDMAIVAEISQTEEDSYVNVIYARAAFIHRLKENSDYYYSWCDGAVYLTLSQDCLQRLRSMGNSGYAVSISAYSLSRYATADYVYSPGFEVRKPENYSDVNCVWLELPEQWHEAVADYAAYLALSKEGSRTQDLQKAEIYLQRFGAYVLQAKSVSEAEIDIEPMVQMPFII